MEDDGQWIGRVDFFDLAEAAALWRFVGGIEDEVESGFNVGGGERAAIVESYVGLQVENVGERVGSVPGFGQVAVEIHLCVAGEEAAEDESVKALRLAVGGEAWVEIDGIGFDEEGEGGGGEFCGSGAGEDRKKEETGKKREKITQRRREARRKYKGIRCGGVS